MLVAQIVNDLPAMWETWFPSLSWRRSPGEENGYPLQYSCLENSMDSGAWQAPWGHKEVGMTERLAHMDQLRSKHCEAVTVFSVGLDCTWHSAWKVTECL